MLFLIFYYELGVSEGIKSFFPLLIMLSLLSLLLFLLSFKQVLNQSFWLNMPKRNTWPFTSISPKAYRVASFVVLVCTVAILVYALCK